MPTRTHTHVHPPPHSPLLSLSCTHTHTHTHTQGVEGPDRGGGHGDNPLQQQPSATRDQGQEEGKGRRRRRGTTLPSAIVQETPLDETSVNWMPDERVSQCFKCNKGFDLFKRRHHCRSCGRIFCRSVCVFVYCSHERMCTHAHTHERCNHCHSCGRIF